MNKDFCQALAVNNKAVLKKAVNDYLATLDPKTDFKTNATKIKAWLESNDCVKQVTISDKIIEVQPPVAQFIWKDPSGLNQENTRLEIHFDPQYRFYDLKKY